MQDIFDNQQQSQSGKQSWRSSFVVMGKLPQAVLQINAAFR